MMAGKKKSRLLRFFVAFLLLAALACPCIGGVTVAKADTREHVLYGQVESVFDSKFSNFYGSSASSKYPYYVDYVGVTETGEAYCYRVYSNQPILLTNAYTVYAPSYSLVNKKSLTVDASYDMHRVYYYDVADWGYDKNISCFDTYDDAVSSIVGANHNIYDDTGSLVYSAVEFPDIPNNVVKNYAQYVIATNVSGIIYLMATNGDGFMMDNNKWYIYSYYCADGGYGYVDDNIFYQLKDGAWVYCDEFSTIQCMSSYGVVHYSSCDIFKASTGVFAPTAEIFFQAAPLSITPAVPTPEAPVPTVPAQGTVLGMEELTLARMMAPETVLGEILMVIPIAMACLVGYAALRKALALLARILRQA